MIFFVQCWSLEQWYGIFTFTLYVLYMYIYIYICIYIYMYIYIFICIFVFGQRPASMPSLWQQNSRSGHELPGANISPDGKPSPGFPRQELSWPKSSSMSSTSNRVVVFNPKGLLLNGIGLPSIWHLLEGPGMFLGKFICYGRTQKTKDLRLRWNIPCCSSACIASKARYM